MIPDKIKILKNRGKQTEQNAIMLLLNHRITAKSHVNIIKDGVWNELVLIDVPLVNVGPV